MSRKEVLVSIEADRLRGLPLKLDERRIAERDGVGQAGSERGEANERLALPGIVARQRITCRIECLERQPEAEKRAFYALEKPIERLALRLRGFFF